MSFTGWIGIHMFSHLDAPELSAWVPFDVPWPVPLVSGAFWAGALLPLDGAGFGCESEVGCGLGALLDDGVPDGCVPAGVDESWLALGLPSLLLLSF
jgi:hypothetical protein